MKRLIFLSLFLFGAVKFIEAVAGLVHLQIDYNSFWAGIAAAALASFGYFLASGWWDTVTRPSRPQTITLKTTETPSQITWAASWAIIKAIALTAGVVFVLYLLFVQ